MGWPVGSTKTVRSYPNRLITGPFSTAAGVRARLVSIADDGHILNFIFRPQLLSRRTREILAEHVGPPDYHACACAPSRPILAIGTEESTVLLLDVRDGQICQELDVASGHPTPVSGLQFASDTELIVADGRSPVTFFAS